MRQLTLTILITLLAFSCSKKKESAGIVGGGAGDSSSLVCPAGFINVPSNAGGMGLDEFCVMKYEAKAKADSSGVIHSTGDSVIAVVHSPISDENGQPWRNITAVDAFSECQSLGQGYSLISNIEWMSIARSIESVDANWTGGSVGAGCLYRGNSGETTCGYNSSIDPDFGSARDNKSKLTLSNGEVILDFSGNVWEYVDWDKDTSGFQLGPVSCQSNWMELPSVTCAALSNSDFNSDNGTYTSAEGMGRVLGGSGGASARGGAWANTQSSGIYSLVLFSPLTFISTSYGFRCVYRGN